MQALSKFIWYYRKTHNVHIPFIFHNFNYLQILVKLHIIYCGMNSDTYSWTNFVLWVEGFLSQVHNMLIISQVVMNDIACYGLCIAHEN